MSLQTLPSSTETPNLLRAAIFSILIASGCAHAPETVSKKSRIDALISITKAPSSEEQQVMAIKGLSNNRKDPLAHKALVELANAEGCASIAATAALAGEDFDFNECPEPEDEAAK